MSELNGLAPKQFDIEIEAGLWFRITPVPPMFKSLINKQIDEQIPPVDVELYRKKMDGSKNSTFIDSNNPEYIAKVATRSEQVNNLIISWQIMNFVAVLDENKEEIDRETLIEAKRPYVEMLRNTGVAGFPENEWEATIKYGFVDSQNTFARILTAMHDRMPVTADEVLQAGFRRFQYPLRGKAPIGAKNDDGSRGVQVVASSA